MLQREAIRDLRQTAAKDALKEKTIEPKREDESMQEFKARIRKETRKVITRVLRVVAWLAMNAGCTNAPVNPTPPCL